MLLLVLQQYLTRIPTRKCGRGQRQYLTREYTPPSLLSLESPPFDHSRSLTVHSRKKKTKTLNGWEVSGELAKRCRFWFGDNLTENMDVAVGEKQCPPFCQWFFLGRVYPFLSNVIYYFPLFFDSVPISFSFFLIFSRYFCGPLFYTHSGAP